jgi:peptidoglycan/xylan/chitin deacetylase (PgdA/CDA1 family)
MPKTGAAPQQIDDYGGAVPRLVNVCFHGIGSPARELEPGEAPYWIAESEFLRILDVLAGREEVRLSFDDGNASDVEIGLPALRERGLRATFFALAGRLGSPGSLSGPDLRDLTAAGMTIGSHGMDHVPWRGLSPAAVTRELEDARATLAQESGTAVDQAALPLGRYDRTTLGHLRRLGYTAVHTSDRRPAREGAWLQPRHSVRAGDSAESVARDMLAPPTLPTRVRGAAVGLVKRWR